MDFTYFGHSCFLIDTGKEKLLFDPFLTGNPLASVSAAEVDCDYIFLSHGHGDHFGDAPAIAGRTGAQVIAIPEVIDMFPAQIGHFLPMNLGGTCTCPFGTVKMVPALHSCGAAGGISCGFVLQFKKGITVYFAGDTALFGDMSLIGPVDYAVLPIGDNYTMGPEDACRAAILLKAKHVIPIHYNTFPVIRQDVGKFKEMTEKKTGASVHVLQPGGSMELIG